MARGQIDLTDESRSPIWNILWLAWPLFLEQILATFVSFADTAMVGSLGVEATASVSISNSFVFLLNGAMTALGTGLTAYIARSVGAKDYEAAKAYVRHSLILLAMVGLPLVIVMVSLHRHIPMWMGAEPEILDTAAEYMLITSSCRLFQIAIMVLGSVFRGRGDTKTPLVINTVVNLLNVTGNYLLIYPTHEAHLLFLAFTVPGAGMGVAGAALSTGLSWVLGGTALGVMLFTKKDPSRISLRDSFLPDIPLIGRVVKLSVPAMLERMSMSLSGIVVTRCIASLGTIAIASNSVYSTVESISYMPAFAFSVAATTLVGQALGGKKPDLAIRYTHLTNRVGILLMTGAGICLYVFARPLCSLITRDEEAIKLAVECLRVVAFVQPIQTAAWIYAGALRGAGDTRYPFYITTVCNWCIRALGVVLCIVVLHLSLPWAVFCMCLDNLGRMILTGLRFRGGKWKTAIQEAKEA